MRGTGILSAVAVAAALAGLTATPAFADETDDIFIATLEREGVPFATSSGAIALAEAVCEYVKEGQPPEQVAAEITGPTNWSLKQSGFFVGAATQSYCPS
ncbi:MAG: DUF732 domain-containing protein [Actinomycetia bacterium]|nr:DUF732 domain-containing protein [Actinomycetes bacterium]MCH9702557.1 DUF732 domain-containing protein [Actinomycetes bacterium]MCH9759039.1 DUF732 domain-containing protein [Actinomycetes bacterium]